MISLKIDAKELLEDFDWLHLSGISPALSPSCADFMLKLMQTAKEMGLTVSFDGNFRSLLWTWDEARDFCTKCLPYVDVLFGIEPYHLYKDDEDPSKGDYKDGVPLQPSYEQQDEIFQAFVEKYPNIRCIARHVRYAHSGSENSLMAYMWYKGPHFRKPHVHIQYFGQGRRRRRVRQRPDLCVHAWLQAYGYGELRGGFECYQAHDPRRRKYHG